jgi:hypothetical protein
MKRWMLFGCMVIALAAAGVAMGGSANDAQKISELRVTEPLGGFLLRLPASAEAQILYAWALAVWCGMAFTWFGKWKVGQADARYFIENFRWTMGSLVTSLGAGVGGIVSGAFETSSGEFVGWWSVLYHGGIAGAAIDWAMNKGNEKS